MTGVLTSQLVFSESGRGVQHYVIKLVSDLRQVCGFIPVLWFPPPIKPITMIFNWNIVGSDVKHHQTNKNKQTNLYFLNLFEFLKMIDWLRFQTNFGSSLKMIYNIYEWYDEKLLMKYGFLWVLRFPAPIKLTAMIFLKVMLYTINSYYYRWNESRHVGKDSKQKIIKGKKIGKKLAPCLYFFILSSFSSFILSFSIVCYQLLRLTQMPMILKGIGTKWIESQ